jgi:two-component system CheB/CheR fusion protein
MENNKVNKESQGVALHYMKTLVEVARESFLILDSSLKVISANPIFYKTFRVTPKETENKFLYKLGNGQWDIPNLKRLMDFEKIGQKTMLLNARQIDSIQLIILAIEDISGRKKLEQKLADYTKKLEVKIQKRTAELANKLKELEAINKTMVGRELKMVELKKEIQDSKKKSAKTHNGINGNGKKRSPRSGNSKNGNGKNKRN